MAPKTKQNDNIKTLSRLKSEVPEGWNTPMIISEPSDSEETDRNEQREGEYENAVFFGRSMRTLRDR